MNLASNSGSANGVGQKPRRRIVLALIRHGIYAQPEGVMSAHLPYPLTAEGERQAEDAVEGIVGLANDENLRIHSVLDASVLLRAWQTAQIISKGLASHSNGPFRVEEFSSLTERNIGSATNLTIEEIEAVVAADPRNPPLPMHWRSNSDICLPFPGAESLVQAGRRVADHLVNCAQQLAATTRDDCIKLIVGHGGSFRHAALALGLLDMKEVGMLSMEHCSPVVLEYLPEGSWSHLRGSWKPRSRQHAID